MVRAKFFCYAVRQYQGQVWNEDHTNWAPGTLYDYLFQPVTGGSVENDQFFASTPTGQLSLVSVRGDQFVAGQYYYLDFSPVARG